jgi:hypothetical protein
MFLFALPIVASATEVEADEPITEVISSYFQENFEETTVVSSIVFFLLYYIRDRIKLKGTIGTLNNNAIAVANNSAETIKTALAGVAEVVEVVNKYKDEVESLLGEIRKSAEEKKSLEETLAHVEGFLKTSKLATIELSNEVAELLVLANIPISKKEELYSRHRAAVDAIAEAEGEVTTHDGEET